MSFNAPDFLAGLFQADRPAPAPTADPLAGIRSPDDLPPYWREHYEERAAVREYDGGQVREHAEAEALRETVDEMRRQAEKCAQNEHITCGKPWMKCGDRVLDR
jgi:hypothetical protein